MTTIQKLLRLNKDLKTRLSNLTKETEMAEESLREKDYLHSKNLREKDEMIKTLQEYIATCEADLKKYEEEQAANAKHIEELNEKIQELRD